MSISTQFGLLKTFSDKIWLAQDSVQISHPVLQLGFHLEQFAINSDEFCTESACSKVTKNIEGKATKLLKMLSIVFYILWIPTCQNYIIKHSL
jgi:hypothetical protein